MVACITLSIALSGGIVLHGRVQDPFAGLIFLHDETPDAGEEARDAFDAAMLHGFVSFSGPMNIS